MATPNATVTRTNVLAGPGQLWYGIYGTAVLPSDSDVDLALNDIPSISGGWTDAGATSEGLTVVTNQSFFEMRVDQVPDKLGHRLTERDIAVNTNLAEGTFENLCLAFNVNPASAITSGAGWRKLQLVPGQAAMVPEELSVIVDGWAPSDADGTPRMRRVILPRVNSIENVEAGYMKDGLFVIPVSISALYVDANTSPVTWIDEVDV